MSDDPGVRTPSHFRASLVFQLTSDPSIPDTSSGRMSIRKRSDREYSAHLQGTLDLLILKTLILGAQHGQGIARAIQDQSGDVLIVDHGSLYPALQRLEERGFIEADWGTSENNRKARFYKLTRKGRKELIQEESEWRRIASAIMRVLEPDS